MASKRKISKVEIDGWTFTPNEESCNGITTASLKQAEGKILSKLLPCIGFYSLFEEEPKSTLENNPFLIQS